MLFIHYFSHSYENNCIENHRNHESCGNNCLGAIPRNSQYVQCQRMQQKSQSQQLYNCKRSVNHYTNKIRFNDIQNRLPPIKEFRSPTKIPMPPSSNVVTTPRLR